MGENTDLAQQVKFFHEEKRKKSKTDSIVSHLDGPGPTQKEE